MKRLIVSGLAVAALSFGAVSCGSGDSGPRCIDYDHDKVKVTVTPDPKRTYDRIQKRWENGPTPKPYVTTSMRVQCEEWETESPTPTNS